MSTKRLAILIVAVVGAFALTLGIVLATRGGDSATYDDDTEQAFMADCTRDGGDDVAPACQCWYDAIVEEIAYDRFEEVSAKLVAQLDKDASADPDIPDDFLALLQPCRVEVTTTTEAADDGADSGFSTDAGTVPNDTEGSNADADGGSAGGENEDPTAPPDSNAVPFGN